MYNNSFYAKVVDRCASEYLGSVKNELLGSITCCNRSKLTLFYPFFYVSRELINLYTYMLVVVFRPC